MGPQAQDRLLGSDWYERRGIVVADDLRQLRGPRSGKVALPVHLDGSAHREYDLDDPYSRELLYRTVLMEAGNRDDLATWLERDTLVRCWRGMYLPRSIRAAWERRHPILAELRDSHDVAGP